MCFATSISTAKPIWARPASATTASRICWRISCGSSILSPRTSRRMDVIGDVYEYLIERFAASAGKKAGEFYTPAAGFRNPGPARGPQEGRPYLRSGLRLRVAADRGRPSKSARSDFALYGQEMNGSTWALCKMNMFLHEVDCRPHRMGRHHPASAVGRRTTR